MGNEHSAYRTTTHERQSSTVIHACSTRGSSLHENKRSVRLEMIDNKTSRGDTCPCYTGRPPDSWVFAAKSPGRLEAAFAHHFSVVEKVNLTLATVLAG